MSRADGSSLVALTNASEAMRIDSSQRVLIGATASRTVQGFATRLQVEGTAATDSSVQIVRNSNDVNPPYINFGKTRGSVGGVTAVADGDILGEISWGGADGGDLNNVSATIQGVAEATATNNDTPGRLVFKTTASGAGASTERMRITEHGSVGIGCTPDDLNSLDIQRTATSSDYRLKTDAQPMTGASDRVLALKPVNFEWISSGERVDGFLAHEAQAVVPECVTGTKDAMRDEEYEVTAAVEATYDEDGNELTAAVEAVMGTRSVPDYQGIDQSKLVPLLTAALQEALTERCGAWKFAYQP
jgi:hypothetical protein